MRREEQLRENLEELIYGYMNGQYDCGEEDYPNLTVEQWWNYCVPDIYNMRVNRGSAVYHVGICDDLRFLGNEKIKEVIIDIASSEGLIAE